MDGRAPPPCWFNGGSSTFGSDPEALSESACKALPFGVGWMMKSLQPQAAQGSNPFVSCSRRQMVEITCGVSSGALARAQIRRSVITQRWNASAGGPIERRVAWGIGVECRGVWRSQIDATKWTSATDVQQPRIDAVGVEFMVARQDTQLLSFLELVGTNGAAKMAFSISTVSIVCCNDRA